MPFSIAIYKIALKPPLKFIAVPEDDSAFSVLESFFERAVVFIELVLKLANAARMIVREIARIRCLIFP
jgi:hypothetical protein